MAFGVSTRSAAALALVVAAAATRSTDAWVSPIVTKGNKFFNADSGLEFRMKGMAYYPRPNAGEMADVSNYDWAADEHEDVWSPHIEVLKDLGVNTIRLYSVDPSKSHDKFMCACSEAGIYVLIGMTAPCENCSVLDFEPPECYPDDLFTRIQMVYNAFAVYDNTLVRSLSLSHSSSTTADLALTRWRLVLFTNRASVSVTRTTCRRCTARTARPRRRVSRRSFVTHAATPRAALVL
jgi:hypothetical protein